MIGHVTGSTRTDTLSSADVSSQELFVLPWVSSLSVLDVTSTGCKLFTGKLQTHILIFGLTHGDIYIIDMSPSSAGLLQSGSPTSHSSIITNPTRPLRVPEMLLILSQKFFSHSSSAPLSFFLKSFLSNGLQANSMNGPMLVGIPFRPRRNCIT